MLYKSSSHVYIGPAPYALFLEIKTKMQKIMGTLATHPNTAMLGGESGPVLTLLKPYQLYPQLLLCQWPNFTRKDAKLTTKLYECRYFGWHLLDFLKWCRYPPPSFLYIQKPWKLKLPTKTAELYTKLRVESLWTTQNLHMFSVLLSQ